MICDIFLPIMPAILCIYCTLGREVQSCTNLAHILHIWEVSTILRIYCALGKLRSRLRIEVRPTENDLTRFYKNGDISVVITCS